MVYPDEYNFHYKSGMKMQASYNTTLAEYEIFFGVQPPQDIWETPNQRFGLVNEDKKLGDHEASEANSLMAVNLYRVIATLYVSLTMVYLNIEYKERHMGGV